MHHSKQNRRELAGSTAALKTIFNLNLTKVLDAREAAAATMTSLEIAELTGKAHVHVMRDVRTMLDLLKKDASNFRSIYEDRYGRQKPCLALDRELTLTLVSGYDVPLRHRVVTRLGELEAAQNSNSKVPVNFSAALRLAAEQAERIESQAAIIECQQPAVEFVERFVESSGLKGFREAAKLLGANEARFREFLESEGVFYRLNGSLMPYQHHVYAKRFVVKTGVSGGGHSFSTAKFTAKGFAWIAGLWDAHESEAANV